MNKLIWLDLEETIITSWNAFLSSDYNCNPINAYELEEYFITVK